MRESLLIGNWKLNGSKHSIASLLNQLKIGVAAPSLHQTAARLVVLPPAIFIQQVEEALTGSSIAWGGQDMAAYSSGAYTGEISGEMLLAFGCQYVLLNHSERRQLGKENDQAVRHKLLLAQEYKLIPILCVGETKAQYQSSQTETALYHQLNTYLSVGENVLHNLVIAYEPLWAIGTGKSPSPLAIQNIHEKLRTYIKHHISFELASKVRILYGGSVNAQNAKALLAMPDVDGVLVGNAALSADTFLQIYYSF